MILSRPLSRSFSRGLKSGVVYDPLAFSPELALDSYLSGSTALVTGGADAGYLDAVAAYTNPGSGSDAVQTTGASQPINLTLIGGKGYLHCSGILGNYASVPDGAALDITGNLTLEATGVLSKIPTSGAWNVLISRSGVSNGDHQYTLILTPERFPLFFNGASTVSGDVSVNTSADGLRVVIGADLRFQERVSGEWSQVGSAFTRPTLSSKAQPLIIGSRGSGSIDMFRGALFRVRIWNTSTPDISTPVLDIDFSTATHNATSFTAATGQTVTINRTGNNPAAIIGKPVVRFDGVDDFLNGTFASAINGGRMFAVFSVLGTGGESSGRTLSVATPTGADTAVGGGIFSFKGAADKLETWYGGGVGVNHANGSAGRFLHESLISDGNQKSLRNNSDEKTDTRSTAMIAERFGIAARASNGDANQSIDLEALYLFPPTMTDEEAATFVSWLNGRLNIF